ncbi:MAG: GYD domain-containing protein [Reyranellaceae bacterium]
MPKYLGRLSLTTEGVRAVQKEGASGRKAAVTRFAESLGGKLDSFYFAFGQDDIVGVMDFPDNAAAAASSVAANSLGHANLSLTPLLTVEEMDKAIEKSRSLTPPGR